MKPLLLLALVATVAAADPITVPLWPGDPPPEAKEEQSVQRKHSNRMIQWVTKVRWPTITVIKAEKPTGAAVIFCPGGGYGGLAYDHEGTETATWFAEREELYRGAGIIGPRGSSTGDPQGDLLAASGRDPGWTPPQ